MIIGIGFDSYCTTEAQKTETPDV